MFFETQEGLVSGDTNGERDVYERSGGHTTLVSPGNLSGAAEFLGVSADGSRVFFSTSRLAVSGDTDTQADIYERSGGQTTLVSTGPAGGNGAFDAFFASSRCATR